MPTAEPATSADAEGLVDTVVATVVEGLSVRLTPGTGGERWSDAPITFDAWWPELPDDAGLGGACGYQLPGGFLHCQHINYNGLSASPEEGFASGRLALSIDPESGVSMPERGQWIRVTGQFDHPAASDCANPDLLDQGDSPEAAVFRCRLQLVPTSVEPLG